MRQSSVGNGFPVVRDGAEGQCADDCVELLVGKVERFGVADPEVDAASRQSTRSKNAIRLS
jgi:hypothetical protein